MPPSRESLGVWLLALLSLSACTAKAPVYGLRPVYPEALYRSSGKQALYTLVESNRPMLVWETFPPRDKEGLSIPDQQLAKVKWVVYDLKVYREENDTPGRLVAEQSGLAEPRHQFQKELEPCAKYFWSVRARFTLDGRAEATEWGVIRTKDRDRWVKVVPDPGYYRFSTPCRT